jgi:hypothetical protein
MLRAPRLNKLRIDGAYPLRDTSRNAFEFPEDRGDAMTDLELLDELKKVDTPTITNVVATYPGRPLCLEIYNPWTENWYTNNTLSCWYPQIGPIAG